MDADYTQNLRYKLQKRLRRLNSSGPEVFHYALRQFWGYLHGQAVLRGIVEDVERRYACHEGAASEIFGEKKGLLFDEEAESVGIGFFVFKKCAELVGPDQRVEIQIGAAYGHHKLDEALEFFMSYFIEPVYEHIDEQLDDQRAVLALLRRYKHKCEWFQRDTLYKMWQADTSKGEKTLALHLYEYLHDQGLDFYIEPTSASGEIDIISAQSSEEPLLADAKIYNPGKGKGKDYLARGIKQIYTYAVDYNESFAYLITYKTCPDDLRLALTNQTAATPYLTHNNKTIFLVVVDIYPHEKTASKQGPLKPIEITEADLIRLIK